METMLSVVVVAWSVFVVVDLVMLRRISSRVRSLEESRELRQEVVKAWLAHQQPPVGAEGAELMVLKNGEVDRLSAADLMDAIEAQEAA